MTLVLLLPLPQILESTLKSILNHLNNNTNPWKLLCFCYVFNSMMQKAEKRNEIDNLNKSEHTLKKIIYAYKKIKQIAKIESEVNSSKSKKPAKLTKEDLDKIKLLESRLGCTLLAIENDSLEYRKIEILNGVHVLLDEYLRLFNGEVKKENVITFSPPKAKSIESSEFNGFFE